MLQLSEFVWTLRSAWVVFNNFIPVDTADRSKISSDQKRLFLANTPLKYGYFPKDPAVALSALVSYPKKMLFGTLIFSVSLSWSPYIFSVPLFAFPFSSPYP